MVFCVLHVIIVSIIWLLPVHLESSIPLIMNRNCDNYDTTKGMLGFLDTFGIVTYYRFLFKLCFFFLLTSSQSVSAPACYN